MDSRRVTITVKINFIIIFTLIAGIGSISFYFLQTISQSIDSEIEQNFAEQGKILTAAIEQYMLPGQATLAAEFFKRFRSATSDQFTVRLVRNTGELAFSDLSTIEDVTRRVPELTERFSEPSERIEGAADTMAAEFGRAISAPPQTVNFREVVGDQVFVGAYIPLLNLPECMVCHGSDHTVQGVIDIRRSITSENQASIQSEDRRGLAFRVGRASSHSGFVALHSQDSYQAGKDHSGSLRGGNGREVRSTRHHSESRRDREPRRNGQYGG